jgi:hypothetical protein
LERTFIAGATFTLGILCCLFYPLADAIGPLVINVSLGCVVIVLIALAIAVFVVKGTRGSLRAKLNILVSRGINDPDVELFLGPSE